jgi:hypothetical protein
MKIVLGRDFFTRIFLASDFAGGAEVGGLAPMYKTDEGYYSPTIIICSDRASYGGHDMTGETLARAAAAAMKAGIKVQDLRHFVHTHGQASGAFYSGQDTATIWDQTADGAEIISTVIGSPGDVVSRLDYRYGPSPRHAVTIDLDPEWEDVQEYMDIYARVKKARTAWVYSGGKWQSGKPKKKSKKKKRKRTPEQVRLRYEATRNVRAVSQWEYRDIWPLLDDASDETLEWLKMETSEVEVIVWLTQRENAMLEAELSDSEMPSASEIQTFFGVSQL